MFFRLKWLQPAMKGTLLVCVRRSCVKVAWFRGCMRNTVVFWSWALQIVVEWLHQGCDSDLSADFLHFGAGDFPLKFPLKSASKSCFCCFGAEIPVLEVQFLTPLQVVLLLLCCVKISRYRIVMAASRLLCAVAACVILLSFYWEVLCASFVVQSSAGKYFVPDL